MEFRLLGPFEAGRDGKPVAVGRRRQERLLLAILLLDAGHAVTTERLTDLLWDGEPPASARGTVHTYIGRLRTALSPHRVSIVTTGGGDLELRIDSDPKTGVVDFVMKPAPGVEALAATRVLPNATGSEVTFTQFQNPGMPDEVFRQNVEAVRHELKVLKALAEVECPL